MKLETYNPLDDLLQSPQDVAEYLQAAYQDDDPKVFVVALGHVVRKHGVSEVARRAQLNRESLYKLFNGKAQPRWDTIQKLLKALNIRIKIAA